MIGNPDYLSNYKNISGGYVTFGDGQKCRIIGKRTLNIEGMPRLRSVLHVVRYVTKIIIVYLLKIDHTKITIS